MTLDLGQRVRRPEYVGDHRCWPCTILNLGIALAGALFLWMIGGRLAAGAVATGASLLFLAGALTMIYFRGYLVPRTPALTARYLPEQIQPEFDKSAEAESLDRDPVEVLVDTGAIEPEPAGGGFCLRWDLEVDPKGGSEELVRAVEEGIGIEGLTQTAGGWEWAPNGESKARWTSLLTLAVDAAAAKRFQAEEEWHSLRPEERIGALQRLRTYLLACPRCGEALVFRQTPSPGCCGAPELRLHCEACEEDLATVRE